MTPATLTSDATSADPTPARRRSPWRYAVWAFGILVIGAMLVAVMLPSLCRSSETANRVKCASNLKQIGSAIALYAQSHAGQYPPSLAVLLAVEDISAEVMTCPSSNDERSNAPDIAGVVADLEAAAAKVAGHKHCLSYVYNTLALAQGAPTETTIVAYEPLDNHDGDGLNVLFGDGHVEFISKQSWPKLARDAGIAIAP